jgi:hypothetical protein
VAACDIWKDTFKEMCDKNIADIKSLLPYADKRLKIYLLKHFFIFYILMIHALLSSSLKILERFETLIL